MPHCRGQQATAEAAREDSVLPQPEQIPCADRKMKIQSLLNPVLSGEDPSTSDTDEASRPSTPSYSTRPTPFSITSESPAAKHHARIQDDVHPREKIRFPPFELHQRAACLSADEQSELRRQYKLFNVQPIGKSADDLIAATCRHIPYSSDKKSFFSKSGKEGFNVYQYTFHLPDSEKDKTGFLVLWDCEDGLVRMTPFFKACRYTKTTPNKALTATPGLKALAISVTGGSLSAQGYWLNHHCARAICLTFCYNIRWALVPIFGPAFLRDCLPPTHPNFGKFKIHPEYVRAAEREANGVLPTIQHPKQHAPTPRSAPQLDNVLTKKEVPPRAARPIFKDGSPFESDADVSNAPSHHTELSSPSVSPKTTVTTPGTTSGWTSINSRPQPPSQPNHSPLSRPLAESLLTQPRFASWRPADGTISREGTPRAIKMPVASYDKFRGAKRQLSQGPGADHYSYQPEDSSRFDADVSASESDAGAAMPPPKAKKCARYHVAKDSYTLASTKTSPDVMPKKMKRKTGLKSKLFDSQDAQAALTLLHLSTRDAQLGACSTPSWPKRPKEPVTVGLA